MLEPRFESVNPLNLYRVFLSGMAVYTGNQEARNLPTISESFIFVSIAISGCFKLEHAC